MLVKFSTNLCSKVIKKCQGFLDEVGFMNHKCRKVVFKGDFVEESGKILLHQKLGRVCSGALLLST